MRNRTAPTVDLLEAVEMVHRHVTEAVCSEAWAEVRTTERERVWTLEDMVRFWVAVTVDPPPSLRHALAQATGERPRYPAPLASPQAFFARSQGWTWEFLRGVFERVRARLAAEAPRAYERSLAEAMGRFQAVYGVDGSNLDAVARRLKALRRSAGVPLAGSILAFYDFGTGTIARLDFEPRVERAEFDRAVEGLAALAPGTLLVGDRLYGVPKFFAALGERGLFGVARRFSAVSLSQWTLISRTRTSRGETVEDFRVVAGTGQTAPAQALRLVRLRRGTRTVLELLTNVMDPERLATGEALALFRIRWKVERLFSDLKEVLKLSRFYSANSNAVGMQVYAAAIVHTALRAAQAKVAQEAGIAPERISTKKFFPQVAAASCALTGARCGCEGMRRANPGVRLKDPDWSAMPFARIALASVLVEVRTSKRPRWTAPNPSDSREPWRSLPRPRGAKRTRKLS